MDLQELKKLINNAIAVYNAAHAVDCKLGFMGTTPKYPVKYLELIIDEIEKPEPSLIKIDGILNIIEAMHNQ